MTGSFATADDPRAADMATGHQQWFGRWRPVELAYDDAGTAMGYIASTASDLATFMQAHLDGHPAIPASAADIITGTVVPTGWDTPLDAGYGHGWFIDERAGTPVASHPGSLGHFTAHILLAPDADGLGIAVVSNASAFLAGHEAQYDIGLGLLDLLLDQQPQPSTPSALRCSSCRSSPGSSWRHCWPHWPATSRDCAFTVCPHSDGVVRVDGCARSCPVRCSSPAGVVC